MALFASLNYFLKWVFLQCKVKVTHRIRNHEAKPSVIEELEVRWLPYAHTYDLVVWPKLK
jgi:hypothetical protein